MKPKVSIRDALADPDLLGKVLVGDSWLPWRTLLIAMMGEALTDDERAVFASLTGREREPLEPCEEFWGVIGRRGGKSRAMAVLAAYLGALCDHSDKLTLGETGMIPVLAATQKQAAVVFGYIDAMFETIPLLAELVDSRTADTLNLTNQVSVEVRPASFRTVRSMTAVAAIADECAFWLIEGSANPDTEILNALRPALATTGGPLVVISSPYARRGEVYGTWKRHYGPAGDPLILVARAASRTMNPSLPQRVVDRALERDHASASAEYLAEFRSDVEALLTVEVIDAASVPGRFELPPRPGVRYVAFTDPSGGSADSYAVAICHAEGKTAVLDAVRERRPPFSPDAVTEEFAGLLKAYGIQKVQGDHYAGEWPRERWRVHGIQYEPSERTASQIFAEMLPLLNGGRAELLEHQRLSMQLIALERRTSRTGKDLISHPPGGHDDLAVAVCGAATLVAGGKGKFVITDAMLANSAQPSAFVRFGHAGPSERVFN